MQLMPLFQTDDRGRRRAQPDASPGASMHSTLQADLIDSNHGLALGFEAALPWLSDITVEDPAHAD